MQPSSMEWKDYGMSSVMKSRELLSSITRVKTVLGLPGGKNTPEEILSIGKYGLGTKRTLTQLSEFIGVDFQYGQILDDRYETYFKQSYVICVIIDARDWNGYHLKLILV